MSPTPFRLAMDRIYRDAVPWLEKSVQHSGVDGRLESLLLLADRLLASLEGCNVSDLQRLPERFSRDPYFGRAEGAVSDSDTMLSTLLEPFLRAVLFRADPLRHEALEAGRPARNNLHALLRELGLAGDHVLALALEDELEIEDFAVRAAFHAKETRNVGTHRAPRRSESQLALNRETFVATLVAALDLHREALLGSLTGLVPHTLERSARLSLGDHERERRGHLRRFVGRADFLESLEARLEDALRETGYVLLLGGEGGGKSAVVAALTQRLAERVALTGAGAGGARQSFPWIGGSLLFFGKQNARARDILESLIEQACICLVEPPPRTAPEANLEFSFKQHLRALQCERGKVVVVIDALDEVEDDLVKLLPASAPKGVVFLLTCRHEHDAVRRLRERLRPTVITLPLLDDADARALIAGAGITDEAWASKALHAAGGLPLHLVQAAADPAGDPSASVQDLLRRKQDRWRSAAPGEPDVVREALFVLALFEPVSMLKLSEVAACLRSRGHDGLTGPILRDRLAATKGVSEDVTSLEDRSLKLSNKPFAEYVREFVVEGGDLAALVECCARWLTSDPDVDLALTAQFHGYWADARRPAGCTRASRSVVREAEARGDAPWLRRLFEAGASRLEAPPILVECLEAAVRLGDAEAKAELGERLLEGRGMAQDFTRAVELLRAASSEGVTGAGITLANRALSDNRLGVTPEDALSILERAHAAKSDAACVSLASALLYGHEALCDAARAGTVLREGVARGDSGAADYLLSCLEDGEFHEDGEGERTRLSALVSAEPHAELVRWLELERISPSARPTGLPGLTRPLLHDVQQLIADLRRSKGRDFAFGPLILGLLEYRTARGLTPAVVSYLREALQDPDIPAARAAIWVAGEIPSLRVEAAEVEASLAEHGDPLARQSLCRRFIFSDKESRSATPSGRTVLVSLAAAGHTGAAVTERFLYAEERGDVVAETVARCEFLDWSLRYERSAADRRIAETVLAQLLDVTGRSGAAQVTHCIAALSSLDVRQRAFILAFEDDAQKGGDALRECLEAGSSASIQAVVQRLVNRAISPRGLSPEDGARVLRAAQESGLASNVASIGLALRSLTRTGFLVDGPWSNGERTLPVGPCCFAGTVIESGDSIGFWLEANQAQLRRSCLGDEGSPVLGSYFQLEMDFLAYWRDVLAERVLDFDSPLGREVVGLAFTIATLLPH